MAHDLEMVNGEAVFLGRTDAWHRLGQVIGDAFDIDTMRKRVPELMMPVRLEPTFVLLDGKYVQTPEKAAVVRADGKIVGEGLGKDSYTVVQQQDVFEWAAQIADLGDFPFISAGLIRDGHQFFATLDAGGFGLAGLRVRSHLTAFGSHDGTMGVGALYSNIVVVCANTWAAADARATDRLIVRHTVSADEKMAAALAALQGVREFIAGEKKVFERLAGKKLGIRTKAFDLAVDAVLPSLDEKARGADQREQARDAVRGLAVSPVVADAQGTGLGFVQAVNTWENWDSPVRGARTNNNKRAEAQFRAVVKGSQPLTRKAIANVLA